MSERVCFVMRVRQAAQFELASRGTKKIDVQDSIGQAAQIALRFETENFGAAAIKTLTAVAADTK